MYFIDFIKSLGKKHRIPVIIYLVFNVVIITCIVGNILVAMGIYALSIILALSPVGEWILRTQMGCKKINRIDYAERLTPIFKEVYARAKQENPLLPDDIELCMNDDKAPNAFATGRKTICLTKGMYENATAEELKGVFAHEFAHIANHDTDLILVVTVGNIIITTMIIVIRFVFRIMSFFGSISNVFGSGQGNAPILIGIVGDVVVAALMWVWTKLGQYLVLATGRAEEYLADDFSLKLGYSEGLCRFLDRFVGERRKGVFAVLSSSHPAKDDRIAKLQQNGCTYRA
ncbi:MAG: M48 family metalloprotease [Lachnospiraceae bacterium]|nr:M48 family metalloprotease [Lachnospiraceae bacterium]